LNNKFYFDKNDKEVTILDGSYELRAIIEFLKHAISRKRLQHAVYDDKKRIADDDEYENFPIVLRANNNTKKQQYEDPGKMCLKIKF